jgi:uncharacterized protein YicC (UPF0701 family)
MDCLNSILFNKIANGFIPYYNLKLNSVKTMQTKLEELQEKLGKAHEEFKNAKIGERQQAWKKRKAIAEELQRLKNVQ